MQHCVLLIHQGAVQIVTVSAAIKEHYFTNQLIPAHPPGTGPDPKSSEVKSLSIVSIAKASVGFGSGPLLEAVLFH